MQTVEFEGVTLRRRVGSPTIHMILAYSEATGVVRTLIRGGAKYQQMLVDAFALHLLGVDRVQSARIRQPTLNLTALRLGFHVPQALQDGFVAVQVKNLTLISPDRSLKVSRPSIGTGGQKCPGDDRVTFKETIVRQRQHSKMKRALVGLALLAGGIGFSAALQAAGGKAVLTPASEIKWADVPGAPGVQMAAVDGDPAKGPHHSMLKFTGGFSAPVHHHTPDHYGTVVSGTLVLVSGGREVRLPAGSHFAFVGRMPHETRCEAGADCVLAIDSRGKWDVVPEKNAK